MFYLLKIYESNSKIFAEWMVTAASINGKWRIWLVEISNLIFEKSFI